MSLPEFVILHAQDSSPQTLHVLENRASDTQETNCFFSNEDLVLLEKLASCVLPQLQVGTQVRLALEIDNRLARGESSGWRYGALPAEPEAYRMAVHLLRGYLAEAGNEHSATDAVDLLKVLEAVQRKEYDSETFPVSRWLENFKTDLARCWLAAPQTMSLLKYEGFADERLPAQTQGETR